MEKIKKLKNGEQAKIYNYEGVDFNRRKNVLNEITVDFNNYEHSFSNKPSSIYYTVNFNNKLVKQFELWYNHGTCHRLTGPAVIYYSSEYKIIVKEYWIDGKQLTQEEFEIETNRIKLLNEI